MRWHAAAHVAPTDLCVQVRSKRFQRYPGCRSFFLWIVQIAPQVLDLPGLSPEVQNFCG